MKFTVIVLAFFFVVTSAATYGFGQLQPYRSEFVYCHDNSLEVDGLMTQEDWKQIRKRPIRSIHTLGNPDPELFEDSAILKGVREIILLSSKENSLALNAISRNCPHVEELAISQTFPLTETDMKHLSQLKQLFFLEISNDMPSCASFAAAVSPKLTRLILENTRVVTAPSSCQINLPVLSYFSLRRSKISQGFIEGLNAPNLEEVSLSRVWGEPGTFQSFSRFHKLKRVFAYNMPQSSITDLEDLQRVCPGLKVVFGDSSESHQFQQ